MTGVASVTDTRVARLRGILDERELDGMLISRIANKRYFSGLRLMEDEEATWPGTLLVTRSATIVLADSRYTEQAERECPGWEVILTSGGIGQDLPPVLERLEVVSLGMEAEVMTHADWTALAAAAPGVELHAMDDELVPLRLIKTDDELAAIARACALADAGFAHLMRVRPARDDRAGGRVRARGLLPRKRSRWARLPDDRPRRPAGRDAARPAVKRDRRAR